MEAEITDARVEVDRRSLADLIDLTLRAADTLKFAEMGLSDALRGAATQVQIETYIAG
jgi:hypothetical protein